MQVEFAYPLALALFPVLILVMLYLYRSNTLASRRRSLKARVVLAIRSLVILLAVLALSAPSILSASSKAATWALLDVSDSTSTLRADMEAVLSQGVHTAPEDLQVGVIAFGGDAMVETPLSLQAEFAHAETSVDPEHSDASKALQLAGALLPSDAAGRILLISDGLILSAQEQAALLKARGIPVDVMPFATVSAADAQVTKLTLPSSVYQGQSYQVTVTMDANADTHGTLILYANREPVATRDVTLRKGKNTFVFNDTAKASGVVTYEAQLVADGDTQTQNNRLGAYMAVTGKPTVLLVEGLAGEGREIQKILTASGFALDVITPIQMPQTAEALRKYDATVLVNADADDFSAVALASLDTYVKTLGRGLAVLGGDRSYALGGYRGSKLEDILPVTIDVKNQMDLPSLALVLIIDKSGSMSGGQLGTTRLEVAKEAAMRSVELLTAKDQVGVIAFDDAAKWVVPLESVSDVSAIQSSIGTIRPGGGTAFYTPLGEALLALTNAQAKIKHVIFLTDGESGDNGYDRLVDQMAQNGITLTTVAVGSGANTAILSRLAEIGKGRAYAAGEFDNIPKIFTKETFLVTGAYVQNRTFTPVITEQSALTDYEGFPQLTGYLATSEKSLATVSMVSDRDDPILAWWQYGAGRSLAWTSDAKGAWTGQFLSWDQAADFFSGLVAHVLPNTAQSGEMQVEMRGSEAAITYKAPDNAVVDGLETSAQVLLPDGTEATVALSETAPGVYEGSMSAPQQGAYAIRVEQKQDGSTVRQLEGGAVRTYSEEYDLRSRNVGDALKRIADLTGGRVIVSPDEMFSLRGTAAQARTLLRSPLLIALLLLFLLDIALRRLSWDRALIKAIDSVQEKRALAMQKKAEKPVRQAPQKQGKKKDVPLAASASNMADNLLEAQKKKKHL